MTRPPPATWATTGGKRSGIRPRRLSTPCTGTRVTSSATIQPPAASRCSTASRPRPRSAAACMINSVTDTLDLRSVPMARLSTTLLGVRFTSTGSGSKAKTRRPWGSRRAWKTFTSSLTISPAAVAATALCLPGRYPGACTQPPGRRSCPSDVSRNLRAATPTAKNRRMAILPSHEPIVSPATAAITQVMTSLPRLSGCLPLGQQLPQHGLQDTAVSVVVTLDGRIDTDRGLEFLCLAVGRGGAHF